MTEQEQKAFDQMREALKQALYVLQVPIVSCQKGAIKNCNCRSCVIERGDEALTAANAVSDIHASDCAVHNEPAYPNGPCNCDAASAVQPQAQGEVFNEFFHFGPFIDAAGIRADDKAHVVVNKLQSAIQQHFSANAAHPQATEPQAPLECDSPELCKLNRACAGQFGTKKQCAAHPQATELQAQEALLQKAMKLAVGNGWIPKSLPHDEYLSAWALMSEFLQEVAHPQAIEPAWRPIETAPEDGYMLVYEDEAIRALFRYKGTWQKIGYPAIVCTPYGDALVGEDAKRILPSGCTLEIRDGCCENPTHWMPLPAAPEAP